MFIGPTGFFTQAELTLGLMYFRENYGTLTLLLVSPNY